MYGSLYINVHDQCMTWIVTISYFIFNHFTDGWSAYKSLSKLGFKHKVVNHSKNFVDPKDKSVYTQVCINKRSKSVGSEYFYWSNSEFLL